MSLADILESEIQGEIGRIQAEARARADAVRQAAQEQAQALVQSRQRSLENDYAAGLTRARSAADLDSNAQRLSAADTLQVQAFQEAERQLRALPQSPEYVGVLEALIREAHGALPQAEAIEAHSREVGQVQQAAQQAGLHLEVRPNDSVSTGVRLIANGGKASVQNTLLGRLQMGRDALGAQVARLMGPQA